MKTWSERPFLLLLALPRCFGDWGTSVLQPRHVTEFHLVQQPQERGRHLSKGSTGAHGNNRGVMSPLGRACVHEWLRRDTAPLNVTYTLSFIMVSRLWHSALGLSVSDDVDAARLWQLSDYSRGNLVPPALKTAIIPDLFVRRFCFSKAYSQRWDGWCGSVIFF